MPNTVSSLIERVYQDWGELVPQARACSEIIEYLASRNPDQLLHITHGSIKAAVNHIPDEVVFRAINYLSGDRLPVLKMHFEFYDDEVDEYHEISPDSIRMAEKIGSIINPRTGEEVKNYKSEILLYFTLGSALQGVYK